MFSKGFFLGSLKAGIVLKKVKEIFENILETGINTGYQHFFPLFQQCFLSYERQNLFGFICHLQNAFSLDKAKVLSGKEFKNYVYN